MLRIALSCAVVLAASPASAATVVFVAPAALRARLSAELSAQGREPLDLSPLDEALFGAEGSEARLGAGQPIELTSDMPKELKDDLARGLLGCRARGAQTKDQTLACAEHLVSAVWERHLSRLHPERVIELKAMPMVDAASVMVASYKPGEPVIGTSLWPGTSSKELKELVTAALRGELPATGGRPNTEALPEKTPPPSPQLRQGAPQSLEALRVPEGCTLPAKLKLKPENVPLATTISTLWEATAAGHLNAKAKPLQCTLELNRALVFHCGSELASEAVFAGTAFGDAQLQATWARRFVMLEVHAWCANQAAATPGR